MILVVRFKRDFSIELDGGGRSQREEPYECKLDDWKWNVKKTGIPGIVTGLVKVCS